MRTTINIDEQVLATAKDEARLRGLTLGQYVERALQHERAAAADPTDDPELPIYEGEFNAAIGEMSNRELQDFLDEELPWEKLR